MFYLSIDTRIEIVIMFVRGTENLDASTVPFHVPNRQNEQTECIRNALAFSAAFQLNRVCVRTRV